MFLADRTNGRAYATLRVASVCRRRRLSSVTLCIVRVYYGASWSKSYF